MEKAIKLVFLFSPLLLALWGFNTTTGSVAGNCLEMIGSEPESFSGHKNLKFEPSALPRVGGTHSSGLTVSFRINVQQYVSGWNVIFHCGPDPFRTPATWFHSGSTRVHPRVSTSTSTNSGGDSSGNVFDLKKWHHAAYVLNNKELLFYVDGEVVMRHTINGNVIYSDGTHPFYIGHDTAFNSFNGQLKFFRFYDFALSEEQLKEDESSLQPITEVDDTVTGLVAGNCLEMIGSEPESFSGHKNLKFEPSALPRVGGTHSSGLTVSFRINVQQYVNGWNIIFHCGPDPFRTPATWFHSGSTRVHPRVSTSTSTNSGGDSSGNVFDLNKWHHAAYVLNNKELLFYVDGEVVMRHTINGNVIYSDGTHPFYIGHDTAYPSFNGQLKFFRFYDFALSKEQLKDDESSLKPITEVDATVEHPTCESVVSFYESLVNNETLSDVTFFVDGTRIFGHRVILAARSAYFNQLLGDSMRDLFTFDGVSEKMFVALMKYLYAGRVPSDYQEAIKLMITLDHFSIGNMAHRYNDTLEKKLTIDNACDLLITADKFVPRQDSMVQTIMAFMSKRENFVKLINGDDLYKLPQKLFREFLKYHFKVDSGDASSMAKRIRFNNMFYPNF